MTSDPNASSIQIYSFLGNRPVHGWVGELLNTILPEKHVLDRYLCTVMSENAVISSFDGQKKNIGLCMPEIKVF